MRRKQHIKIMSQKPAIAQTNLAIKLEGTTEIIDRFLLAGRQAPWKAGGPFGEGGGVGGGGIGGVGGGGIGGEL